MYFEIMDSLVWIKISAKKTANNVCLLKQFKRVLNVMFPVPNRTLNVFIQSSFEICLMSFDLVWAINQLLLYYGIFPWE